MKKIIIVLILFCFLSPLAARDNTFSILSGGEVSYQELIKTKKTVFLTWAIWCPYCRRELERIAQKCLFFDEVEVYFVNIGDKRSVVDKFIDSRNFKDCIRDRIILDQDSYIAKKFNIIGIPTYIFLKDGVEVEKAYFLDQEILDKVYGPR